jgi:hypothetical protein
MDLLIGTMLDYGLEIKDLEFLENLSDPKILRTIGFPRLRFNLRKDVIRYMETWADLMEQELLSIIHLTDLKSQLHQRSQIFDL